MKNFKKILEDTMNEADNPPISDKDKKNKGKVDDKSKKDVAGTEVIGEGVEEKTGNFINKRLTDIEKQLPHLKKLFKQLGSDTAAKSDLDSIQNSVDNLTNLIDIHFQ